MSDEKYDIPLPFERANEEHTSGRICEAKFMFRALSPKAKHYPWRLFARHPEDHRIEKGRSRCVTGRMKELSIAETISSNNLKDSLVISGRNLQRLKRVLYCGLSVIATIIGYVRSLNKFTHLCQIMDNTLMDKSSTTV